MIGARSAGSVWHDRRLGRARVDISMTDRLVAPAANFDKSTKVAVRRRQELRLLVFRGCDSHRYFRAGSSGTVRSRKLQELSRGARVENDRAFLLGER